MSRFARTRRHLSLACLLLATGGLVITNPQPATAYDTNGLMFAFDFSNLASTANGASLNDVSGNGRNGTIRGTGLTYSSANQALVFPGGNRASGNYVELAGDFSDFTNGATIEFEGESGSSLADWERIFDFGNPGGEAEDFWVGHMGSSGELTLEVWKSGVNQGRCHTAGAQPALNTSRTFAKWLITLDATHGCRIYKNGVEIPTQIRSADYQSDTASQASGSPYPLPNIHNRTTNYLGRSNWTADADFEGSIRYIRIYNRALTPEQVLDNATTSSPTYKVTFDANGGTGTISDQLSSTPTNLTSNTFVYPGYTFAGWKTGRTSGTSYGDGAQFPFTADTTLYAQWTAIASSSPTPESAAVTSGNSNSGSTTSTASSGANKKSLAATGADTGDLARQAFIGFLLLRLGLALFRPAIFGRI